MNPHWAPKSPNRQSPAAHDQPALPPFSDSQHPNRAGHSTLDRPKKENVRPPHSTGAFREGQNSQPQPRILRKEEIEQAPPSASTLHERNRAYPIPTISPLRILRGEVAHSRPPTRPLSGEATHQRHVPTPYQQRYPDTPPPDPINSAFQRLSIASSSREHAEHQGPVQDNNPSEQIAPATRAPTNYQHRNSTHPNANLTGSPLERTEGDANRSLADRHADFALLSSFARYEAKRYNVSSSNLVRTSTLATNVPAHRHPMDSLYLNLNNEWVAMVSGEKMTGKANTVAKLLSACIKPDQEIDGRPSECQAGLLLHYNVSTNILKPPRILSRFPHFDIKVLIPWTSQYAFDAIKEFYTSNVDVVVLPLLLLPLYLPGDVESNEFSSLVVGSGRELAKESPVLHEFLKAEGIFDLHTLLRTRTGALTVVDLSFTQYDPEVVCDIFRSCFNQFRLTNTGKLKVVALNNLTLDHRNEPQTGRHLLGYEAGTRLRDDLLESVGEAQGLPEFRIIINSELPTAPPSKDLAPTVLEDPLSWSRPFVDFHIRHFGYPVIPPSQPCPIKDLPYKIPFVGALGHRLNKHVAGTLDYRTCTVLKAYNALWANSQGTLWRGERQVLTIKIDNVLDIAEGLSDGEDVPLMDNTPPSSDTSGRLG